MGPVKIIAMVKGILVCRHCKGLFHDPCSRVQPARDWHNDGDKVNESGSLKGKKKTKNVENDKIRERKLTKNRAICRKSFEEYVERKNWNLSAKQFAAILWNDEQTRSTGTTIKFFHLQSKS